MGDLASVLIIMLPITAALAGMLLLKRAMRGPDDLAWRPLTDIVAGLAMLAFAGLVFFFSCGPTGHDRRDSMRTACLHNLMRVGQALQIYASDYDGWLPPRNAWCDAIADYHGPSREFRCPELRNEPFAFWINDTVEWHPLPSEPTAEEARLVMCFDAPGGKNRYGGIHSVEYRHKERTTLLFADGHAKSATKGDVFSYKWIPHLAFTR